MRIHARPLALAAIALGALAHAGEPAAPAAPKKAAIRPDQAIKLLQDGNERFVAGRSQFPNHDSARRAETATLGQRPFAAVLSCSDSRAPVEAIFDRGVGDIFAIRVAGNVCQTSETASAEYAVGHLGAPLLVVMGHSSCGAVTAAVQNAHAEGSIPALLDSIKPAVAKAREENPEAEGNELIAEAIKDNVWQSIEDLLVASPSVRAAVAKGSVRIIGAVYRLDSGSVSWLGEHPQQAKVIAAANAAPQRDAQAEAAHEDDDEAPSHGNKPGR